MLGRHGLRRQSIPSLLMQARREILAAGHRAPNLTEGYLRAAVLRLWRRRQQLSSATTKKAVEAGIRRIFYANVC